MPSIIATVAPPDDGGAMPQTFGVPVEEIVRGITSPEAKERFFKSGSEVVGSTPAEFRKFIEGEIERFRLQVKISGAKVD